jgi:threonine dehydrogenase-like Zn-dependent dehydrogenase
MVNSLSVILNRSSETFCLAEIFALSVYVSKGGYMNTERVISVIGLGYVGLPVAVAFGKVRRTVGFDINPVRISELQAGYDRTDEVTTEDLQSWIFYSLKREGLHWLISLLLRCRRLLMKHISQISPDVPGIRNHR